MHRIEANPVHALVLRFSFLKMDPKKDRKKRKQEGNGKRRKQRSRGKECAAAECSSFEFNSDGSRSGLHFFKFPTKNPAKTRWCNLIKRQDRRDSFRVSENTICEKHFRKHDIIKGVGGVRCRLRKGMIRVLEFMYCRFHGTK